MAPPIVGVRRSVNLKRPLRARFNRLSERDMSDDDLALAVERAERALSRIERAIATTRSSRASEERLRAKVREAVAELDSLIEGAA